MFHTQPYWYPKAVTRLWGAGAASPASPGARLPWGHHSSGRCHLCSTPALVPAAILTASWGGDCHLHSWLYPTRKKCSGISRDKNERDLCRSWGMWCTNQPRLGWERPVESLEGAVWEGWHQVWGQSSGEIQPEQRKVKGSTGRSDGHGKGKIKKSQGFSCLCLSIHGVTHIHTYKYPCVCV